MCRQALLMLHSRQCGSFCCCLHTTSMPCVTSCVITGHGTHVAGIIGAMNGNSSRGVVGVSPGTGVFSLKVLDGYGQGMLSKTLDAVKWVTTEGRSKHKINVINLSLVAAFDKQNPSFQSMVNALCQFYQDASDAGTHLPSFHILAGLLACNIVASATFLCFAFPDNGR